jgi:acetylornithine deacetylase/succinyl-diaminopimelate desuccinylase-like protein
VIAKKPAPAGRPTVLLYAHHDVQRPVTRRSGRRRRSSRPSAATGSTPAARRRQGGIAAHLAAVRAFGNDLPVGVTVFVEGEEEIGSPR